MSLHLKPKVSPGQLPSFPHWPLSAAWNQRNVGLEGNLRGHLVQPTPHAEAGSSIAHPWLEFVWPDLKNRGGPGGWQPLPQKAAWVAEQQDQQAELPHAVELGAQHLLLVMPAEAASKGPCWCQLQWWGIFCDGQPPPHPPPG